MVVTYSEIHARYASKATSFGVAVPSPEAHRKLLREWYDGILSDEQLTDIVSEINDAAAEAVPKITGDASADRASVVAQLVLSDLGSRFLPYDGLDGVESVVELRRALRMAGRISEANDASVLISDIRQHLCGPMMLQDDFPRAKRQRITRGEQAPHDIFSELAGVPAQQEVAGPTLSWRGA